MDVRTSQLLQALDPLAVELLLSLLEKEASEKELVQIIPGALQPTVHKKLSRLAEVGLVQQGTKDGRRGSPWIVTAPSEVTNLLLALVALGETLDSTDRRERTMIRDRLASSDAAKPGLRIVKAEQ